MRKKILVINVTEFMLLSLAVCGAKESILKETMFPMSITKRDIRK